MPVTNVTIDSVQPTDSDVTVQWESDQMAFSSAVVYVAATQAGLDDPAQRVTGVGLTPDTEFKTTVPADSSVLNSGSAYFVRALCDGVASADQSFNTLPVGEHLHNPNANPLRITPGGAASTLSVVVKKHKLPVPNIPVTFTAPDGSGQLGPVGGSPVGLTLQAISDANGLAQVVFTSGSALGAFKVVASAPGYAVNQPKIRVAVRKKA